MKAKLTYSGTVCNSYVYFSFSGVSFDPNLVTKELKIKPTLITLKKEPIPKSNSWKYQVNAGAEIDLGVFTERLMDLFESKSADINRLKERLGLETRLQV